MRRRPDTSRRARCDRDRWGRRDPGRQGPPPADPAATRLMPVEAPRGLLASVRQGPWPRRPNGGGLCRSLTVADVDLDQGVATPLPTITPPECPSEGVH